MPIKPLLASLALLFLPALAQAQPLLEVRGPDAGGAEVTLQFDEAGLAALPNADIETRNDYVDGRTRFTGPLLRDLLAQIALAPADKLILRAHNDYHVTIPAQDIFDYDVIAARQMDGTPMTIRDKGPLWIIYPMDDHPELMTPEYHNKLVWQLKSIEVE